MARHHRRLNNPSGLFFFFLVSLAVTCIALWKLGVFSYHADQGGSGTNVEHIGNLEDQIRNSEELYGQ